MLLNNQELEMLAEIRACALPSAAEQILIVYKNEWDVELSSLRSALAEKTARIDELEALNEDWIEVNNDQCAQIDTLTEQVKRLREALTNIYDYGLDRDGEYEAEELGELVDELVKLAREALAATAQRRPNG